MPNNRIAGVAGEREVVRLVPCPNCKKKLMALPPNYPLYDLQCTGCSFRAQVKTNCSKPKGEIFGAGWDIIEKVMKSGFMVPALIVNFKWSEKGKRRQKILFYPFIPRKHLRKRQLSDQARRKKYKMFNYIGLSELPCLTLHEK